MSDPVKVDSVIDPESKEEIGITPVADYTKRDWFVEDAMRQNTVEIVCAITLAVLLITLAIGLSKVLM